MKRHIDMGSIPQFREIVRDITTRSTFSGLDENGEAKFNENLKKPIIMASASEKTHGSQGSICYSEPDGFWVQSRNNIITVESDNAGCAFAAHNNESVWTELVLSLAKEYSIDLNENIVTIYFEWCGGNIQKNSCVYGLDKMAIIFKHFKVSPIEPSEEIASYCLQRNSGGECGSVARR